MKKKNKEIDQDNLPIAEIETPKLGLLPVGYCTSTPSNGHPGGPFRMTLYIPLDAKDDSPISPPFLVPSSDPAAHLTTVIQSILRAKRITVVCGAGISVEAGIPDFR